MGVRAGGGGEGKKAKISTADFFFFPTKYILLFLLHFFLVSSKRTNCWLRSIAVEIASARQNTRREFGQYKIKV